MHAEELGFVLSNYTLSIETAGCFSYCALVAANHSLSDAGDGPASKRVGSNSLTVLLWCAWQVYSVEMWFECAIRAH